MTDRTAIIVLRLRGDGDPTYGLDRVVQELRFTRLCADVEIRGAVHSVVDVNPDDCAPKETP